MAGEGLRTLLGAGQWLRARCWLLRANHLSGLLVSQPKVLLVYKATSVGKPGAPGLWADVWEEEQHDCLMASTSIT